MGHRELLNTIPILETDHDQLWDHMQTEDPFLRLASSPDVQGNSFFHSGDNVLNDGTQFVSHQNPSATANVISSSMQAVHTLHNHSDVSSTHSLATANNFQVSNNHAPRNPGSQYIVENGAFDLIVGGSERGQCKRKSPMISSINEMGSASSYFSTGSSSDPFYGRQSFDFQHNHREVIPPGYNCPIRDESSLRNVRSRPSCELDPNMLRLHPSTNYANHLSSSGHPSGISGLVDHSNQVPTLSIMERNHIPKSSASHGRTIVAGSGNLSQDASPFVIGSSVSDISGQMGGYNNNPSSSRNPAIFHRFRPSSALTRGVHGSFPQTPQRPNLSNQVVTGSLRLGQTPPLEEGLRLAAVESSSTSHPRTSTSAGWRNGDRARSRLIADRYRSFPVNAAVHDHRTPEGMTFVHRSSIHGSRGLSDQHREMRLDVDNMSYEELLALGERIGTVNTGLSDDQMSKCLIVMLYVSPEEVLAEERCVICLEEYQDMDQIGGLKSCNHEFHMECIKKWLSMKNSCPICKLPAVSDDSKKEKMKAPV